MKNVLKFSKTIVPVIFSVIILNYSGKTQDLKYSQSFYANPLKLNPAEMGKNTDFKAILNYRNQWAIIDKGYTTYSFAGMYPLYLGDNSNKLDIGLNVINDNMGAYKNFDFSLSLGYNLKIAESNYLGMALQGGYLQNSINTSNLTFDDQYVLGSYSASNTSAETIASEKQGMPDVGFGLMWFYKTKRNESKLNGYFGVSGFHLNEPDEAFLAGTGKLPRRFSYQVGVTVFGENKLDFTPNIIANYQNGSSDVSTGLYIDYNFNESSKLVLGVWYKRSRDISCFLGFEHKHFMLGYSYDVANTRINSAISGLHTHEVTLAFKLNMQKNDNKAIL